MKVKVREDKFYESTEGAIKPCLSSKSNPIRMKDALFSLKNDLESMFPVYNVTSFHRPSLSMDRFEKLK
jgi:hypothetical protein